jgi:hypothetical protein
MRNLNVVVFGPWSSALHWNMVWFHAGLPADVKRWHAQVEEGEAWYLRYEFLLPERPGRREALKLTVSSKTGAICAPDIERRLLAAADGVLFTVDDTLPSEDQLDEALAMLEEANPRVVVFQFDHVPYEGEPVHRTSDELRTRLRVGDRPFIVSRTWDGTGVMDSFKLLVERMLAST